MVEKVPPLDVSPWYRARSAIYGRRTQNEWSEGRSKVIEESDGTERFRSGWRVGKPGLVIAHAAGHPTRLNCWSALIDEVASPTELDRILYGGDDRRTVAHHVAILHENGVIRAVEFVTGGRRRGGTETFYTAVQAPEIDKECWEAMAVPLRSEVAGAAGGTIVALLLAAMENGDIGEDLRAEVTWMSIRTDAEGEDEIEAFHDQKREELHAIKARNAERIAAGSEQVGRRIVAALGFNRPERPSEAMGEALS
jgi:hypothetical protein